MTDFHKDFVMWCKFSSVHWIVVPQSTQKEIRKLARQSINRDLAEWAGGWESLANLITWVVAAHDQIENPGDHPSHLRVSALWDILAQEQPGLRYLRKNILNSL